VMRPKRPGDQQQTGNEQEGFCKVVSHDEESTPHRFRCQSGLWSSIAKVCKLERYLWSVHFWSAKTPSGLELAEGGSVGNLVR
jgi:hypothetical protein